jgi:hypothetical protein
MPIHSMMEGFLSPEGLVHRPNAAGSRHNDALWSLLQACRLPHCPELQASHTNHTPEQQTTSQFLQIQSPMIRLVSCSCYGDFRRNRLHCATQRRLRVHAHAQATL